MKLESFKEAHSIFCELSDLSFDEAKKTIEEQINVSQEVKNLVFSLLVNANQPSQFFDDKISGLFEHQERQAVEPPIGGYVANYELLEKIGEGGMSKVYRAKRTGTDIQKEVALKIFAPLKQSNTLKERFADEQKILSTLSHPNIIAIQHGGSTDEGQLYFVMDLIEDALSINEYVVKNQLSSAVIVGLILCAAQAIEHAHNNMVIHRDLKPSNIIIDKQGILKVVDFGIAKLIPANKDLNDQTLLALTPTFASPEQINGQSISVKTDIFSLAAVCLNLLTEKPPFPENRLIKACQTDDEHIQQLLKSSSIEKDLTNILNKALQQDPQRRYANMHAFAQDLNAWLHKKPVMATADSYFYRLVKFTQRRRALSASLLVLIITCTFGVLALSWQYNKTRIESQKATAVKQFMLDAFSVTDPNVSEGIDVSAQDILKNAAEKLADNKVMDRDVKFELFQSLGLAYGELGEYIKGTSLLKASLEIDPNNSHSLAQLAQFLFNSKQEKELVDLLSQVDESNFPGNDQARILRIRSNNAALKGDYASAFKWMSSLSTLKFDKMGDLTNQRLEAEIYYLMGQSSKSIEIIKAAIQTSGLKPTNTFLLTMQSDLIHYYDRVNDIDSALALALEVAATHREVLGNKHDGLGVVLNEIAVFYRLKGDFVQSKSAAEEGRELFYELYGDYSAGLSQAISNLAMLDYMAGNSEAAIDKFTQSTEISRHVYSSDHPETLVAEANLATIMTASGQAKEAKPLLEHVYQVESKTLGAHHRSTLYSQQSLALNLAANGEFELALEHAKDNHDSAHEFFDHKLPFVVNSQFVYGRVLSMAGKSQEALDMLLPLEATFKTTDDVRTIKLSQYLARTYAAVNEPNKAEAYFKKAISGASSVYTAQHIKTLEARFEYAQFLKSHQRIDETNKIARDIASIIDENNVSAAELSTKLAEF